MQQVKVETRSSILRKQIADKMQENERGICEYFRAKRLKRNVPRWSLWASALLAMVAGALTYIMYGPITLLVFDWIRIMGMDSVAMTLRQHAGNAPPFHQSIPDGLWVYGSTLLLAIPWINSRFRGEALGWILLPLLLALGAELGQAVHKVEGTYDPLDLIAYTLGGTAAYVQIWRIKQ